MYECTILVSRLVETEMFEETICRSVVVGKENVTDADNSIYCNCKFAVCLVLHDYLLEFCVLTFLLQQAIYIYIYGMSY